MPEPEGDRPSGAGLVLSAVVAGYGAREVLHSVSMEVRPGEVVGLIGPNGSGKTTVVRVASRGLRAWAGTVRVGGRDPHAISARRAARLVAVVPQEVAPAFEFSVLEMVLMGRSPYRSAWGGGGPEDWAVVRDAMARTDVVHLSDRPMDRLSGGERQRVILAQALAQGAPVLLLDEPTTHLDLRHVVGLLGVVRALARREGTAVLAIFHDLNLAAAYCDRLYALDSGRVVASGRPASVITPDLVASLFGVEAAVTEDPVTGIPAVLPSPLPEGGSAGSVRAHVIGGAGRGAGVMRMLAERGFFVTAGVLHAVDTDAVAAERLNLLRITVPAFSAVDRAAAAECLPLLREAAVVVVCDPPFGPGNVENLRLALAAQGEGASIVLFERQPIRERDFTGGEATAMWDRLALRSRVVRTEEELELAVAGVAPRR